MALNTPGARVLNVGDPQPPTVRGIGEAIAAAMGHAWEIVGLPGPPRGSVGASPWSIPAPLLVDMSVAEALGYRPVVAYADAMPELCSALRDATEGRRWEEVFPTLAGYPWPLFDYAAEDAALAP
jgi:nucleoside-diphosphate-sugar epimerase